eukprot:349939-Pelagomonas_calceolata.AAC.2
MLSHVQCTEQLSPNQHIAPLGAPNSRLPRSFCAWLLSLLRQCHHRHSYTMPSPKVTCPSALQNSPGDQALGAQLVDLAVRGPLVGGVDRGVAIHVGAVLVLEAVHAIALRVCAWHAVECMAPGKHNTIVLLASAC